MALIACWECGKEISDSAAVCPHCGAAAKAAPGAAPAPSVQAAETPSKGGWLKWVLGVPAALLAAFLLFGALQPDNPEKTQARRAHAQCLDELASADRARNGASGFIAGTCERMRRDFRERYGVDP